VTPSVIDPDSLAAGILVSRWLTVSAEAIQLDDKRAYRTVDRPKIHMYEKPTSR
jgi:hypothetical protein